MLGLPTLGRQCCGYQPWDDNATAYNSCDDDATSYNDCDETADAIVNHKDNGTGPDPGGRWYGSGSRCVDGYRGRDRW